MMLQVISLKGVQYEGDIKSVNVKTTSGEITVLDHHLPLITVLTKGQLVVEDTNGKETVIHTESGFLEVKEGNQAVALIS
ncbi:MAG TPA: hypothetical protein VJK53_05470 [Candidatus Paceibacterota bacterium]